MTVFTIHDNSWNACVGVSNDDAAEVDYNVSLLPCCILYTVSFSLSKAEVDYCWSSIFSSFKSSTTAKSVAHTQ